MIRLGKLIEVLSDLIAFYPAKEWLIGHAEELYKNAMWGEEYDNVEKVRHRLEKIKKRIFGYSTYEVDGAFESPNGRTINCSGTPVSIFEERTLVVRFLVDIPALV